MDAKITLSFEESVIKAAKKYAQHNHISLSRLTEFLYKKITESATMQIEELPISEWVQQVSEGEAEYKRTPVNRKSLKAAYFEKK